MEYKTSEEKREYAKQYYWKNREALLAQMKVRRKGKHQPTLATNARRLVLRDLIQQQKVGRVCMRCGIDDPRVLDFHHVDKDGKEERVSALVARNWSAERILQEIAKCETLCANCHRILHWEERKGEDACSSL